MRKIIFILVLLSHITSSAKIISAGSIDVNVESVQKSDRVPMGEFLGSYVYPSISYSVVSANVDGFVTEIFLRPYEIVKKNQKLFIVKSPELLDLQSDYINILIELEFYKKEILRVEPLAKKGVVASKQYLQNKNLYEKLKASAEFKRDILKAYGLDDIQLDTISTKKKPNPFITINAPLEGVVSEISTVTGSFVSQGGKLATLVDTKECYLKVNIPWQISSTLRLGEKIYSQNSEFLVYAIAPHIDTASQTREIKLKEGSISCSENAGSSINVMFYKRGDLWKVPSSALVISKEKYLIFVQEKDGFRVEKVNVASQQDGYSYIDANITNNDKIAVSSVLTLKSAMEGDKE